LTLRRALPVIAIGSWDPNYECAIWTGHFHLQDIARKRFDPFHLPQCLGLDGQKPARFEEAPLLLVRFTNLVSQANVLKTQRQVNDECHRRSCNRREPQC